MLGENPSFREGYEDRPDPRRLRYVEVSRLMVLEMFKEDEYFRKIVNGLPQDAVLVGMDYMAKHDLYELVVHSQEFDVTPEGAEIPRLDVTIETIEGERIEEHE